MQVLRLCSTTTVSNSSNDWNKLARGLWLQPVQAHDQMYTTYRAREQQGCCKRRSWQNNGLGFAGSVTIAGGKAHSGFEFGVRHSF
jgi:hypothetical protein